MSCYAATLQSCPGNDDLQFVYGVEVLSGLTNPHGTIVFFSGGGGNVAADGANQISLIEQYVAAGYQVVQIAWGPGTSSQSGLDWEFTNVNGGNPASIVKAACRPATFLNWVRNGNTGVGAGIWGGHGGMCAQGHSAGSAALAYALAWYNAGAATATNGQGYLDKAVFTSGPVFSDIGQGCEVPNNQYTYICESPGQTGCVGWGAEAPPGYSLEYTTGYKGEVNAWTGNTAPIACANNSQATSGTQMSNWFQQSILYNLGTQQPSFNYSKTPISAWLCETVVTGVAVNNAAPEGQLYWAQFTSQSQAGGSLSVNAITLCPSTEDVLGGTDAADGNSGIADVFRDMTFGADSCESRH